jgi:hypothetical protein
VVLQIIAESKEPNTGSDSLKQKRNFFFAESKKKLLLVPGISKT